MDLLVSWTQERETCSIQFSSVRFTSDQFSSTVPTNSDGVVFHLVGFAPHTRMGEWMNAWMKRQRLVRSLCYQLLIGCCTAVVLYFLGTQLGILWCHGWVFDAVGHRRWIWGGWGRVCGLIQTAALLCRAVFIYVYIDIHGFTYVAGFSTGCGGSFAQQYIYIYILYGFERKSSCGCIN